MVILLSSVFSISVCISSSLVLNSSTLFCNLCNFLGLNFSLAKSKFSYVFLDFDSKTMFLILKKKS